ncbi:hypothetical protein [Paenibacillus polymyxa]|uniref:hypothetical protein n=1 Tax=Paenibacillus polymyxa TaxID=1406 RepID=UPI000314262D|nr:hypothetical protein [Paenibacillus polymyxa]
MQVSVLDETAAIRQPHYPLISGSIPHHYVDTKTRPTLESTRIIEAHLKTPQLISSSEGAFKKILFTIPSYAVHDPEQRKNPYKAIYMDLLHKLPEYVELIIIVNKGSEEEVQSWLQEVNRDEKSTIIVLPDNLHFSVWAEDAYTIVHDSDTNKHYFLEPLDFIRYADSMVAEYISNETEFDSLQTPLHFQGGNILIGDTFFLIGADYPALTLKYVNDTILPSGDETPQQTVYHAYGQYLDTTRELFYVKSNVPVPIERSRRVTIGGELWTEHIYYGNIDGTQQPLFHIDMFVTLIGRNQTGKYVVLVGSPKLAADLLAVPLWDHSMNDVFDSVAEQLRRDGFEVQRNPLPLAYFDDKETKTRQWYFCTYNNALVERTPTSKKVWLPTFGYGEWGELQKTDLENKTLWESMGYQVIQITDCHVLASNLGVLHCIKKYLERS